MQEDLKEILVSFFAQSATGNLSPSHFPSFYSGLKLKVGFGVGRIAKISWITFLGKDQEPQDGIFPVYYFFKEHYKLILAYGISETNTPRRNWIIEPGTKTVVEYFKTIGITPYKYGSSYVYQIYDTIHDLKWKKMEMDLDNLLEKYKQILQTQ
jgi:5-methylcytosine-specific restriction protein B